MENSNYKNLLKKIIPIIIIALILVIGYLLYNTTINKPEKIFKKTVAEIFEKIEMKEENKNGKANIEITAQLNSEDETIQEIQSYLDGTKIRMNQEIDVEQKILKTKIGADYKNEELIEAGMFIQDGTVYLLAEEFFDKYIEISEEELGIEDFETILEEAFEQADKVSKKETNKLLDEIEETIINFLKEQEYESDKEEISLEDKTVKAKKSTLSLNEKEISELLVEILKVLKESEYFIELVKNPEVDIVEEIEYLIEELEEVDTTDELDIEITLYTKGIIPKIVKAEIILEEYDEELGKLIYEKENDKKAIVEIEADEESFGIEILEKDNETTELRLVLPEEYEGIEVKLEIKKEKNKGELKIIANISEEIMSELNIEDEIEAILNIKYEENYEVEINKEDISNSTTLDKITENEQKEILKKFEDSNLRELLEEFGLYDTNELSTNLENDILNDLNEMGTNRNL